LNILFRNVLDEALTSVSPYSCFDVVGSDKSDKYIITCIFIRVYYISIRI